MLAFEVQKLKVVLYGEKTLKNEHEFTSHGWRNVAYINLTWVQGLENEAGSHSC